MLLFVCALLVAFTRFGKCHWPPPTYQNPVLWEDTADIDVIRIKDTFYYSASSMHYPPGAPILRSFDLVNWEFVGHSVPVLDFPNDDADYDLIGGQAYVQGVWASFFKYRESNGLFYWGGSSSVQGPWKQAAVIEACYYDCEMLIDDDDTMYVSYGGGNINVAQLSEDGLSQVSTQVVFESPSDVGYIEGSRFYKVNGNYYILVTHPANAEYVLMSTGGPFGPYSLQALVDSLSGPISGGEYSHQGGIVDTAAGDWYYLAFQDAYPGGRVPVLAPIEWGSDGFPILQSVNDMLDVSYPYPNVPKPSYTVKSPTGIDSFHGTSRPRMGMEPQPGQLKMTATITGDLYAARNTLTHRILGPSSTATIVLHFPTMADGDLADGDRAGLTLLRNYSAWIGVSNITMNGTTWDTINTGTELASAAVSGSQIWLRASVRIVPGGDDVGDFSYSFDGTNFTSLGDAFVLDSDGEFFMGYRFGIFNYATKALGVPWTLFLLSCPPRSQFRWSFWARGHRIANSVVFFVFDSCSRGLAFAISLWGVGGKQ